MGSDMKKEICWSNPCWDREMGKCFWDPGRQLLGTLRKYQAISVSTKLFCNWRRKIIVLQHRFWSVVSGADIQLNSVNIEGGLLLPHPNGIVLHPDVVIGANCLIFQQVTITSGVKIGFHVDIGAGAKIIGPLSIGDNVRIGANAVVTKDIPSDCTVCGIPAQC